MSDRLSSSRESAPELRRVYVCAAIEEERIVASLNQAASHLSAAKQDYHLTLRFIDSLSSMQLNCLMEAVGTICGSRQPFELTLAGPGFFPGVAWCGLELSPALMDLQGAIERAVLELGLPSADYDYNPHITLARLKPSSTAEISPVAAQSWLVEALEIRQSKEAAAGSKLLERVGLGSV